MTNLAWASLHVATFIPFIQAAIPEPYKLFMTERTKRKQLSQEKARFQEAPVNQTVT